MALRVVRPIRNNGVRHEALEFVSLGIGSSVESVSFDKAATLDEVVVIPGAQAAWVWPRTACK